MGVTDTILDALLAGCARTAARQFRRPAQGSTPGRSAYFSRRAQVDPLPTSHPP